jgi:hypothetical protein
VAFLCQAWDDLATHIAEKGWTAYEDGLGELMGFEEDEDWESVEVVLFDILDQLSEDQSKVRDGRAI